MSKPRKQGNSTTLTASSPPKDMIICVGPTCLQGDTKYLSVLTDAVRRAERGMAKSGVSYTTGSIAGKGVLMTFQILRGVVRNATGPNIQTERPVSAKRRNAHWRKEIEG